MKFSFQKGGERPQRCLKCALSSEIEIFVQHVYKILAQKRSYFINARLLKFTQNVILQLRLQYPFSRVHHVR
jgi:hypothetical protein